MNITVEVKATELADAINNLAVALGDMMAQRNEMKAVKTAEAAVTKAKKPVAPAPAQTEPTPPPVAEGGSSEEAVSAAPVTLEQVRAKLKDLGEDKLTAVKDLIATYGVKGLSKVPEEKLGELLEKALAL